MFEVPLSLGTGEIHVGGLQWRILLHYFLVRISGHYESTCCSLSTSGILLVHFPRKAESRKESLDLMMMMMMMMMMMDFQLEPNRNLIGTE